MQKYQEQKLEKKKKKIVAPYMKTATSHYAHQIKKVTIFFTSSHSEGQ